MPLQKRQVNNIEHNRVAPVAETYVWRSLLVFVHYRGWTNANMYARVVWPESVVGIVVAKRDFFVTAPV